MELLGFTGEFKGGEVFKPKVYFWGWWGKYRKINSFRIIGQGISDLLCPINSFKWLIINNL
jgi:hypothetical protein